MALDLTSQLELTWSKLDKSWVEDVDLFNDFTSVLDLNVATCVRLGPDDFGLGPNDLRLAQDMEHVTWNFSLV